MLPPRLERLPCHELSDGLVVFEARGVRARLFGLALLDELPSRTALLLPRCRSIHTFGMRFPLDVVFLDEEWRARRVVRGLPPRRTVACASASAVLETLHGEASPYLAAIRAAQPTRSK
ncbi:MAG TPA: DUF192 domain-containing protein [Thermoleophilaceae bacterium]|nr:DUF192 domain-containing protein [Thermoleophilaceae bacterium]